MGAVAHALTCIFFRASRRMRQSKKRPTQYLTTMYWAFATMTTVGYGDEKPSLNSASSLIVTIVSQVLGTMIFAYVIGILVSIVTNLDQAKRQLQAEKSYLSDFLCEIHSISPTSELLLRVRRNHHHFLLISGVFDERRIVDLFPPHMQTVSTVYVHRAVLPYLPLLSTIEKK